MISKINKMGNKVISPGSERTNVVNYRNRIFSKFRLSILIGILIFIVISGVDAHTCTGTINEVCDCSNCSDCNSAISTAGSGSTIRLTADISNHIGTCIDNPANFNNKIFSCQGHTIDGNYIGGIIYSISYGIYLNGRQNNTIKNCIVTEFSTHGIYLEYSTNNTLTNNTANLNHGIFGDVSGGGIYLSFSSNNTLTNNTANTNGKYGISLSSSSNNNIINNTANLNGWWGIYLYNSSNNTITNNIANSNGGFGNGTGIYLSSSSNNNIINNTANSHSDGIDLLDSTNNTLTKNTIYENKVVGIYSKNSTSTLIENRVCNNTQSDLSSSDWLLSSGDNNTCDNPDGWNDTGTTGCTYTCSYSPVPPALVPGLSDLGLLILIILALILGLRKINGVVANKQC